MPYYGGWFFFPFGFIFFLFFVFFIGRLLFWPWAGGWGWRRGYYYRHDEAADILRQRYARGEITKEQFVQMMRDLEQHA
jgi:putative membrane protein